jgi:hypothetical protein
MITSCYKITVEQFCDCLCDKQYNVLGDSSEDELLKIWNNIYVEYCDLMNDASYNDTFNLIKDMQLLNAKINIITQCVDYLMMARDEDIEKILYEAGVRPEKNFSLLQKKAVARIKKLTAELITMQQDLDKLMDKKREGGRDCFEDILLTLSSVRKVHLTSNNVTVFQFCRMIKEAERQSQKHALDARN